MAKKINKLKSRKLKVEQRNSRAREIREKQEAAKRESQARFNVPDADDLVQDPRYAVKVSRQGKGRNVARLGDDETFKTIVDPADPAKQVEVQYYRGGLARLHQGGVIDDNMLEAGQFFQAHFEVAGYCNYTTVDLSGSSRGGSPASWAAMLHIESTTNSRAIVGDFLRILGYPNTQMSKAAWWVIGYGMNLEEMANNVEMHELSGCKDLRYWRAMVVAALQMMSIHFRDVYSQGKKRGKMRGQSNVGAQEYTVREGVIHSPKRTKR